MIKICKCRQCGTEFTGGPRAFFCPNCRAERQREQGREYQQRKLKGAVRVLGTNDTCAICRKVYTVNGPNQMYCPDCAPEAVAQKRRELSLQWYDNNKNTINPVRKIRRRQGMKICPVCGQTFDPQRTRRKCCSSGCSRIDKNKRWRDIYNLKKD